MKCRLCEKQIDTEYVQLVDYKEKNAIQHLVWTFCDFGCMFDYINYSKKEVK